MLSAEPKETAPLGAGYRAVPVHRGDDGAPLRLSLVIRDNAEPVGGPFVLLRDLADASVYLGCVTDAAGSVREWIEIWVQNLENFEKSFPAHEQVASNHSLDERWKQRAALYRELEPEGFIATGWESVHPAPIFFDLQLRGPVHPIDEASNSRWQLCQDDALLKSKGLPEYNSSLVRYLHLPNVPESPLLPATAGAPENEGTRALIARVGNLLPFNAAGGLMMVRSLAPIALEDFVELLSGRPWKGIEHGKKAFKPTGVYRTLHDANAVRQGDGHLFTGKQGRAGQMVESFHLKLHLLAAAVRLVRSHVQAQQLPFLNLSAASFHIRLGDSDAALPVLWNFRVTLATPGAAIALPVASTEARYFVPPRFAEMSVYRPTTSQPIEGRGGVRIRKVLTGTSEEVSLEGTLATQERVALAKSDLLWLRLTLPSGRIDLYANLDAGEAAAPGEVRFRTLPQRLSAAVVTGLQQAEGVALSNVAFETLPLRSTPCDLYALAVLAVRTLFVGDDLTLPVALDEIGSLARQAAAAEDPATPLAARLAATFQADLHWAATLGPQRLLRESMPPEQAARLFPAELWLETIALVLRLFPGAGPDSFRRDFGDAPPLALQQVFDEPLAVLEKLILHSRSLIVIDWQANREIGSVIRGILSRHGGSRH